MENSVEGLCQDQHGGNDDTRTSNKRSSAASPKLGATRGTNKEKQVGLGAQSDISQQSNLTQVSKLSPVRVTKRKIQENAIPSPKAPSVYNLRSRDEKTEDAKDPPAYNLRSKIRRTEGQNASTVIQTRKTPKKDDSKDSSVAIQKSGIPKTEVPIIRPPKSLALPTKSIGNTKSLKFLAGLDFKNQPSSSQYKPFFREPVYHIRWEDNDMENRPFGQNCVLCNKDLSGAPENDDSEYNEDLQFEDDDDDDDDYDDYVMPPLLPAVDILSCGHAYHTECLQQGTPDEQSSDPQCVLCSKMV